MPVSFVQVILPLSLHEKYTYGVPEKLQGRIHPGQRVVVQFGKKKYFSALVFSIVKKPPENIQIKEIIQVLDKNPIVLPQNFELWNWMSQYYCCTLGDIFRVALPAGLRLESKSKVFLTGDIQVNDLTEKERFIIDRLDQNPYSLGGLQQNLGNDFSYKALKNLAGKKIVQIEEKINLKYKPKTLTYIGFHSQIKNEKQLNAKVEALQRAKKQKALLIHFCNKINAFGTEQRPAVGKKELLEGTGFNSAVLNELIRKKILKAFQQQVSRIDNNESRQVSINLLNKYQENALRDIREGFDENRVALIHGITASGKTEIYIHLIDEIIKSGRQVLYLVPEIVLTTQIIERLKNVFGRKVGIYHSRLNSQQRVEIWEKVLHFQTEPDNGYQIILGARSAIFLPFSKLGLIIVDEEHENSFKQFDPAPRYNARDMAVILGVQNKAPVLLGSATPSYESYFNALNGKYNLVKLFKRHSNIELPMIIVADFKKALKKRQMRSVLTPELFKLMEEAFHRNEQVILFQNRRGYSRFVQCFDCGWIPKCKNCDVSLTYHKYYKSLKCHYCGYSQPLPNICKDCGSSEIQTRGFGTEKIEVELKQLFPDKRIKRMDLDSTRSKTAFSMIIGDLEMRKTDILIGTQMVTKGLDLEHVSLVGILDADNLINFPDFRAHERAFQLISQVSGRAGRKHSRGKVVVQTSQTEHPLIELIRQQDFHAAYSMEMEERRLFRYPPYYRLIKIIIKHKKHETVTRVAGQLADRFRNQPSLIVLGPEFPLVGRLQSMYLKEIWLKIDRRSLLNQIKERITETVGDVKGRRENGSCVINIDVDPA